MFACEDSVCVPLVSDTPTPPLLVGYLVDLVGIALVLLLRSVAASGGGGGEGDDDTDGGGGGDSAALAKALATNKKLKVWLLGRLNAFL